MNKKKNKLIQDINFLEYPGFVVNPRNKEKSISIQREDGGPKKLEGRYEILVGNSDKLGNLGLPNYFDRIVFFYTGLRHKHAHNIDLFLQYA